MSEVRARVLVKGALAVGTPKTICPAAPSLSIYLLGKEGKKLNLLIFRIGIDRGTRT